MSDIEWTVQLLQMQHAHAYPDLRTSATLGALLAEVAAGLLDADDGERLEQAWQYASDVRDAMMLWRGRSSDAVPADVRDAEGANRILGGGPGEGYLLGETYSRRARHAREVTERVFYGRQESTERVGNGAPAARKGTRA